MKKLMVFSLIIGITGISFYNISIKRTVKVHAITIDFVPEVLSISDLTNEIFSDFLMGKKPNLAIQFGEGESFPCTIDFTGDILMLNTTEISSRIKALKTFYVRSTKDNGWLFSKNLKD